MAAILDNQNGQIVICSVAAQQRHQMPMGSDRLHYFDFGQKLLLVFFRWIICNLNTVYNIPNLYPLKDSKKSKTNKIWITTTIDYLLKFWQPLLRSYHLFSEVALFGRYQRLRCPITCLSSTLTSQSPTRLILWGLSWVAVLRHCGAYFPKLNRTTIFMRRS